MARVRGQQAGLRDLSEAAAVAPRAEELPAPESIAGELRGVGVGEFASATLSASSAPGVDSLDVLSLIRRDAEVGPRGP